MTLNTTIIPQAETQDWLKDDPRVITHIAQAYRECIPTALNPLTFDPRFLINNHIVNLDFIENPMFLIGFHHLSHTVLAVLYVYPAFRNQGIGSYLIQALQQQTKLTIQVAVDASQPRLGKLYCDNGFETLGIEKKDDLGVGYIDYFWSPRPFRLEPTDSGTNIIPV